MNLTRVLIISLVVCAAACGWLYFSLDGEKKDHAVTKAIKEQLLAAVDLQNQTISDLQAEIKIQNKILLERETKIAAFNAFAFDAAVSIEGAENESQPECTSCNIDAPLPASIVQPLRLLYQQTASGYGTGSGSGSSTSAFVSAP